jgi:iron complex outermembrane recepter protein
MNSTTTRLTALLGSASFITIANLAAAYGQDVAPATPPSLVPGTQSQAQTPADTLLRRSRLQKVAQVQEQRVAQAQPNQPSTAQSSQDRPALVAQAATAGAVPTVSVVITGSLIAGTQAIGVPVTNLGVQDFVQSGALTTGELFRTIPAAQVSPGPAATINGGQQERNTRVNLRGLDTTGPRSLLMVDGIRFPPQEDGFCVLDPSIIPVLAVDRIDVLADGASATYGSDAIAGVVNVVLKRGYDGAITLFHFQFPSGGGGAQYQASQLWGRTWDGGDVTLTYEWLDQKAVPGTVHSKYTINFTPWGLADRNPIQGSIPGVISNGDPNKTRGTKCSNCWSIPAGTGQPYTSTPGPAFDWSALTPGVTNELDILSTGDEFASSQKNSFVGTFDQRLFSRDGMLPGVSFFFTGFYNNRRVEFHNSPYYGNGVKNAIQTYTIPTSNPYYPTGVPTSVMANGLEVSYDLGFEVPPASYAYEVSDRYSFGFNLDLPFNWQGKIYDSRSREDTGYYLRLVNTDYAQLALGNTLDIPGTNVTFAKPASIPYLNLFCDPRAYKCNDPATLNYITGMRHLVGTWSIEEKGVNFNGPVFDLPAGQLKVAVGGTYESDNVVSTQYNAGQAPGAPLGYAGAVTPGPSDIPKIDSEPFDVWAAFAQVDIPVFGDNFNIPLFRRFDLEASWRHDQYSQSHGVLNGGTSNPKIGFTWLLDEMTGTTIRGSWGTSFRFANLGESSPIASDQWHSSYIFGSDNDTPITTCPTGSAAAELVATGLFACNNPAPSAANEPGAVFRGGAPHLSMRVGPWGSREGGTALAPEKATDYSVGFEIAPTLAFLRGLDIGATYYSIKLNGVLNPFNQLTSQDLGDPNVRFTFILPSDVGCPVADNANPTACANFEAIVKDALNDFASTGSPDAATLAHIYYLRDGSTTNSGFWHLDGFDFNASYDWDMGDLGVWNAGVTGTYYLHFYAQPSPGAAVIDYMHSADGLSDPATPNHPNMVETQPRLAYRARLGWTSGPYSVTGFMNYTSHYYSPWAVPSGIPTCTSTSGAPCYTYLEPSMYTFDLSLGYDTGDMPANDYLKNISVQLTFQNILDKHPAWAYHDVTSHTNASAYDIYYPDTGRIIGITVQKRW